MDIVAAMLREHRIDNRNVDEVANTKADAIAQRIDRRDNMAEATSVKLGVMEHRMDSTWGPLGASGREQTGNLLPSRPAARRWLRRYGVQLRTLSSIHRASVIGFAVRAQVLDLLQGLRIR